MQSAADDFVPAAREMLAAKDEKASPAVQEKLNVVFDLLLEVPPHQDMDLDIRTSYHVFPMLVEDKEKWNEVTTPGTDDFKRMENFISTIENLSQEMIRVLNQIGAILALHFEELTRRTKDAYAFAFTRYYMTALKNAPDMDWELKTDAAIEFVPVYGFDDSHRPIIAERMQFNNLTSFLYIDFFRGLIHGNCPRRCHNCGKYFLLTAGYNICYCNNIAPGETERTCRKVGAHKKAEKAFETPVQQEYRKAYNRLKVRKNRKKISADEWNAKVAQAQEWKEQAERGQLSDEELREKLAWL